MEKDVFILLIENLKINLRKKLPGMDAQRKMLPLIEIVDRFDQKEMLKAKPGSVLILLYWSNGKITFPLIQRPVYQGVHSGQIGLPGGKKDIEDKDHIATALRETNEEIGVIPSKITILGTLSDLFIPVSNFRISPVIGYSNDLLLFNPDKREVEKVIEADLQKLLEKENIKQKKIRTSSGQVLNAPYFDISGNIVWGATAMILSEFVEVINKTNVF